MFRSGKSIHSFTPSLRMGASVAVLALMTVPAMAQSGSSVENVTVTGSRIITNGVDAPTPVTVVPVTELSATTPSDIPDALNKLPVFEGSRSQTTTGGATINWPGNFLNLRDFGSVRTLILFNGNRVAPVDGSGDVDTNILPQALMSRVDVVTGGASAVYGSDAVTGVVNFVIDQHFNGLKMSADAGISGLGDDASWHASIVGGKDLFGGRGHFEFSYEHHDSDGIDNMMTRPLGPKVYTEPGAVPGGGTGGTTANPFTLQANSRLPNYAVGGYIASGPLANSTFTSNGILGPFVHGQPSGTANDEMGGSGGYGGEAYFLFPGVPANPWLVASLRSDQGFARFDYDLMDNVHFYLQGNATQSSNFSIAFPSNFSAVYNSDNPYLPANARALLGCGATLPTVCTTPSFTMARQVANQPASPSVGYTKGLNVTTGLSGSIMNGRFDWGFNFSHSANTQSEKSPFNINFQKLYAADDAVINPATGQAACYVSLTAAGAAAYPGCIPINPFGPSATTAEQWAYVTDKTYWKTKNGMDDLNASITGTLFEGWAGPVKGALSGEYRNMSLETDSAYNPVAKVNCTYQNPLTCNPGEALYNSVNAAIPQVNEGIAEGAGEIDVPLLKDIPLVELLTFNGAYRFASYSVSGDAQTWKAGLVWNITDEWSMRGAVSRDIRAPTLANLFAPPSGNVTAFTDWLTGASGNLLQVSQGNRALKPEVSRTDTLGFVYKPAWLENFSLMADWYDIRITNAIGNVSGGSITSEQICQQSGGTSFYCGLIVRPGAYNDRSPSNFPTEVLSESENIARNTTHGIDAEADYNFEMSAIDDSIPGTMNMRVLGSYQPSYLTNTGIPGAVVTNTAGAVGVPAGRVTWDVGYLADPISINVQERWHSSERQSSNPTLVYATPSIKQIFYTDLSATYDFKMDNTDSEKNWQAFLSIDNLFNQLPHLYSSTGVDAAQGYAYPYPSDEDVIGRYFTMGIRYKM